MYSQPSYNASISQQLYNNSLIENKILGFGQLPDGWHFGEGLPPSQERIDAAIIIATEGTFLGTDADAFPGINGEVMVSLYCMNDYLEFIIETDGSITFTQERDDRRIDFRENLSLNNSLKLMKEILRQCNSSEFSTQSTMTPENNDSQRWPSGTSVAAYRLYQHSAFLIQEEPFANIYINTTTPALLPVPQFSGYLPPRNYQMRASYNSQPVIQAIIAIST